MHTAVMVQSGDRSHDVPGPLHCDAEGCTGVRAVPHSRCIAHLDETSLQHVLAGLSPGADIDARNVPFTGPLVERLLAAVLDPGAGRPCLGTAGFRGARFDGNVSFSGVQFKGKAVFDGAWFGRRASFEGADFSDGAWFDDARFGNVIFNRAVFGKDAHFTRSHFGSFAWFQDAQFQANAWFNGSRFDGAKISETDDRPRAADFWGAVFSGGAEFDQARFGGHVLFRQARFEGGIVLHGVQVNGNLELSEAQFAGCELLGPATVAQTLRLDRARFDHAVQIQAAAEGVMCQHATFTRHATVLLRYALVILDDVLSDEPLTVVAAAEPFNARGQTTPMDESLIGKPPGEAKARLVSLVGVDCSRLVLTDVDLSRCQFAGTYHLDQLRIEGDCRFASAPTGWIFAKGWPPVWHWMRRQTLAEEHPWRAGTSHPIPWPPPPSLFDPPRPTLPPDRLAVLYRQLRKAQEDAKNEPGAADFYYGEMEMRRHSAASASTERVILFLYWLLSGYALRAARALAFLAIIVAVTTVLLAVYGLPGPATHTGTWQRMNQALLIALNSIVFRAAGQPLTTAGAYTEMAARFTGPVLLALVILAMRNRVKR